MFGKALFAFVTIASCGVLNAQEDGDNFPPIQEGWRCLEESDKALKDRWTMLDVMRSTSLMQNKDCPEVTDEICEDYDYNEYYAYPCKTF